MKNYTAIYDTEKMQNVGYSFQSLNLESAMKFCENKFNVPVKKIIESTTWYQDPKGKDIVVYEAEKS